MELRMRAHLLALGLLFLPAFAHAGSSPSYAVLKEDATQTSRVVAVRIESRLAEADLVALARAIKDASPNPANKHTVVLFYLPGMTADQRPWASADTTPAMKVAIAGLTLADAGAYAEAAAGDNRALTGTWLTELPSAPGRLTIFSEKGKTYLEWAQRGGQTSQDEVTVTNGVGGGQRVDLAGGAEDHYVIRPSGQIEIRSGERLVAVAEPLSRKAKAAPAGKGWTTTVATLPSEPIAAATLEPAATAPEASPAADAAAAAPLAAKPYAPLRKKRVARSSARKDKPNPYVVTSDYMRPIGR
jgi:hypothetical protein